MKRGEFKFMRKEGRWGAGAKDSSVAHCLSWGDDLGSL